MKKYKFSPAPWDKHIGCKIYNSESNRGIAMTITRQTRGEENANMALIKLAPTLHETVVRCQAILGDYLQPDGKTKGQAISALLDILDDKELVLKLKELEI